MPPRSSCACGASCSSTFVRQQLNEADRLAGRLSEAPAVDVPRAPLAKRQPKASPRRARPIRSTGASRCIVIPPAASDGAARRPQLRRALRRQSSPASSSSSRRTIRRRRSAVDPFAAHGAAARQPPMQRPAPQNRSSPLSTARGPLGRRRAQSRFGQRPRRYGRCRPHYRRRPAANRPSISACASSCVVAHAERRVERKKRQQAMLDTACSAGEARPPVRVSSPA